MLVNNPNDANCADGYYCDAALDCTLEIEDSDFVMIYVV